MLRSVEKSIAALVAVAAALALPMPAAAAESESVPEPMPGQTRANPVPAPGGFVVRASNGYTLIVNAATGRGSSGGRVRVELFGRLGAVYYTAPANLTGEGIRADLGRFGQIDFRWISDGRVKEVTGRCRAYKTHVYFATGHYVGSLRFRGGNDFSEASAAQVTWQRRWYGETLGCLHSISEGFPGPGEILEAGGAGTTVRPRFEMVQNGPGEEVEYQASQRERVGGVEVSRDAFADGGPKTLHFLSSFRSAEISPPAPFSGSAQFTRTEHARGTWLGDLSVNFPDRSGVHLAGSAFEAIFHSGFHDERIGFSAR